MIEVRDRGIELPRYFAGHTEDKDLARNISLPNFEVFEGDPPGKRVVRCPIDTPAVYTDTQIRLKIVRRHSPVLGQLWKTITPVLGAGDRNLGGRGFVGCAECNGIAISGLQHLVERIVFVLDESIAGISSIEIMAVHDAIFEP